MTRDTPRAPSSVVVSRYGRTSGTEGDGTHYAEVSTAVLHRRRRRTSVAHAVPEHRAHPDPGSDALGRRWPLAGQGVLGRGGAVRRDRVPRRARPHRRRAPVDRPAREDGRSSDVPRRPGHGPLRGRGPTRDGGHLAVPGPCLRRRVRDLGAQRPGQDRGRCRRRAHVPHRRRTPRARRDGQAPPGEGSPLPHRRRQAPPRHRGRAGSPVRGARRPRTPRHRRPPAVRRSHEHERRASGPRRAHPGRRRFLVRVLSTVGGC